jgi:hypothetical protein
MIQMAFKKIEFFSNPMERFFWWLKKFQKYKILIFLLISSPSENNLVNLASLTIIFRQSFLMNKPGLKHWFWSVMKFWN